MTAESSNGNGRPLLEINDLRKHFRVGRETLKAVDGISLKINRGETLGLVGESGCGKTTAGRVLVRLYEPSGGEVLFDGKDVHRTKGDEAKLLNRKMQMIFQDPQASLNPRMVVGDIVAEGLDIHNLVSSRKERLDRVHELLEVVGLNKEHANRFPHEFSGGQRQRIGVARALAVDPEFIVADELYNNPLHPYTQALLSAVPVPDPDVEHERERIVLEGEVPSPVNPPSGCRFRTRCPYVTEACGREEPVWRDVGNDHWVLACHCIH